MNSSGRGFSLIELMIVVAIIGILAAVAVPNYVNYITKARFTELINVGQAEEAAVAEVVATQGGVANAAASGVCSSNPVLSNFNPPRTANIAYGTIGGGNANPAISGAGGACDIEIGGTFNIMGGATVVLTPSDPAGDGSLQWNCSVSLGRDENLSGIPASCPPQ